MGNSASSSGRQHDDSVDYGSLHPYGVHTTAPDWNHNIVTQLIVERRLAPFYRPLEDYEENWDDDQILASRKEFPAPEADVASSESFHRVDSNGGPQRHPPRRPGSVIKDGVRMVPEANVYRGAIECPICFLYYPPNINHSRCCDQAICTECFVSIKRADPTPQHLVSEPAACPYCVQENFGVTYKSPQWRSGIGSEGYPSMPLPGSRSSSQQSVDNNNGASARTRRRRSFGADSAEVVTIDQIRPDWESKLAAVRAAVARRANRRIIMRQVGDRLIPVGVTSGRVHALSAADGPVEQAEGSNEANGEGRGSRRSRRRQQQQQELNQLLGNITYGGQELEELMVMEAMRLSLLEHEETQRREAEERKKKEKEGVKEQTQVNAAPGAGPSNAPLPPPPAPVPISVRHAVAPLQDSDGKPSSAPAGQAGVLEAGSPVPQRRAVTPVPSSVPSPDSAPPSQDDPTSSQTPETASNDSHASVPFSTSQTQHELNASRNAPPPEAETTTTTNETVTNVNGVGGGELHVEDVEDAAETPRTATAQSSNFRADDQADSIQTKPKRPTVDPSRQFSVSSSVYSPGTDDLSQASTTAYDTLPSSPDSFVSHEPLLHRSMTAEGAMLGSPD